METCKSSCRTNFLNETHRQLVTSKNGEGIEIKTGDIKLSTSIKGTEEGK